MCTDAPWRGLVEWIDRTNWTKIVMKLNVYYRHAHIDA
jgi:hypothetical protein